MLWGTVRVFAALCPLQEVTPLSRLVCAYLSVWVCLPERAWQLADTSAEGDMQGCSRACAELLLACVAAVRLSGTALRCAPH